jgi:hypothetical protein
MANADTVLETRARRAYELGRALLGMRRAALVLPMAAVSLVVCGRPTATCIDAALLAIVVGLCEWRGERLGRGARIGLWAGVVALAFPVCVQITGHACGASFCALYPTICLLGGVAAGAVLVTWGARAGLALPGLAAAGVVAGLAGSLGCLIGGVGGVLGLILGLAMGTVPALVWRRA